MADAQYESDWSAAGLVRARAPRTRELNAREREFILARNHVGRVAFQGEGRIELIPVHYVYANGTIVGRTAIGTKYLGWLLQNDVVFEVDESDSLFDWRSVIVRGSVSLLRSRGSPTECQAYEEAVAIIRTLIPTAFTERDPTPHRCMIFAITPKQISGRVALSR
jgi:nitroimidazol reductase NimA-like FMN-containing flavoprotein (pyridoxamine 5'-phosphate oxidase superfamily)